MTDIQLSSSLPLDIDAHLFDMFLCGVCAVFWSRHPDLAFRQREVRTSLPQRIRSSKSCERSIDRGKVQFRCSRCYERREIRIVNTKMRMWLFSCFKGNHFSIHDEESCPLLRAPSNRNRWEWDRMWGPRGRGSIRRKRHVELPSPAVKRMELPVGQPGYFFTAKRFLNSCFSADSTS